MSPVLDERLVYEILSVVSEIPEGCVASYGQIAVLINRSRNARLVGRVLSQAALYGDYPCHRVVNHAGRTAPGWTEQRVLLEQEGVFGLVAVLAKCEWVRGYETVPVDVRMKHVLFDCENSAVCVFWQITAAVLQREPCLHPG